VTAAGRAKGRSSGEEGPLAWLPAWPPFGRPLRVVGDVHGDAKAFAYATDTDRFLIQLGDLTDHGPDSRGVLEQMFRVIDEGRGLFVLGNHDLKLYRALIGKGQPPNGQWGGVVQRTLAQLDDAMRGRVVAVFSRAPAWLRARDAIFVHGGFHTDMLERPAPPPDSGRDPAMGRALYGEPTGRTQHDGFPERSLAWIDRIPNGVTVYCGHDRRSPDGRPWHARGRQGGEAIFLDTGAGKGGHLSWIDLPPIAFLD
jgi:protein phosphatase